MSNHREQAIAGGEARLADSKTGALCPHRSGPG